jgi:predicted MFS family arabinose efflux permease
LDEPDDYFTLLKEKASRLRLAEFVQWIKFPVLLIDIPGRSDEEDARSNAFTIESTVLMVEAPADAVDPERFGTSRVVKLLAKGEYSDEPDGPISIGRSDDCDIGIDHDSISKVHAFIERGKDGSYVLSDAGSRNGLLLNGRRVHGMPLRLRGDDVIRIGGVMARLVYPSQLYAYLHDKPLPTSMSRCLRDRTFRGLWLAKVLTFVADSLYRLVIVWWVISKGGTGAQISALAICTILALLVALLGGGMTVDAIPRARVLLISILARGATAAVIAYLELNGQLELWHLFAGAVIFGISDAFFVPAATAYVPEIVPRDDLGSANALNTIALQGANAVGPALGAVLAAVGGHALAFALVGVTFLAGTLFIVRLPLTKPVSSGGPKTSGRMREVFRALLAEPWLWVTSVVFGVLSSVGFATTYVAMPVLLKHSLQLDMKYLGVIQALASGGSLVASVWISRLVRARRRGVLAYGLGIGVALSVFSMGLPITVFGVMVATVFRGILITTFALIWLESLQRMVPRAMLGRAASIDAFSGVILLIGAFVMCGWLLEVTSPENVFLIGGGLALLAPLFAILHPRIRAFR